MNLRKALDKAKKERETQGKAVDEPVSAQHGEHAKRSGSTWKAPVYADSKAVSIDLNTAVKNHCVALSSDFVEGDYYKVLRTQLRHIGKKKDWNTIMVTSVSPGEGKTVTAINLSATFAREYSQTVLLVDADLRMQSIHRYLGYPSQVGLLDYLEEKASMADIITWPGIEKFTVISGGRVIEESSELMGSPRMQDLVADLKSRYDDRYVIFDVPPVLGGADALAFAPLVDCIILVVGAGVTRQQDLKKALELLPQEKIAGFVLNRFSGATRLYGRYGERL
jgi:non-specific protein-tyrosine kinase